MPQTSGVVFRKLTAQTRSRSGCEEGKLQCSKRRLRKEAAKTVGRKAEPYATALLARGWGIEGERARAIVGGNLLRLQEHLGSGGQVAFTAVDRGHIQIGRPIDGVDADGLLEI